MALPHSDGAPVIKTLQNVVVRPALQQQPRTASDLVAWVPMLLIGAILGYIALFGGAAIYKHTNLLMGFDLGVHEQVLWNTANGRIAASSAFENTESYLGIDIIPTELLLAPIYALVPTTATMLLLKTTVVALGAIPLYLIVRERLATPWAGLIFALVYLLYLPVQYTTLYEFQIRAFATTFLLAAWWCMTKQQLGWFWLWALLALGCRNEVGLVLAGMGLYALTERSIRAKGLLGWLPIIVGLGWMALSLLVLIPLFRGGQPSLYLTVIYGQFGSSSSEILRTIVTQPLDVLQYMFLGERAPERWQYLWQLFLPLAFLPLLQPRLLLICLPILGLNLLSNSPNIHASIRFHYQALIVPFLLIGTAYALAWFLQQQPAKIRTVACLGVLLLSLACNIGLRNPFFTLIGRDDLDPARTTAVYNLLALVPADAPLTTTNTIGPHAARREKIYFFPGNIIYPRAKVENGDYLLIDTRPNEIRPEGIALLDELNRSGRYRQIAEQNGIELWQKIR
jgi:uncharacterized membrane protein